MIFFRVLNFKKIASNIWGAKSRVQKTGSLLFKKRRGHSHKLTCVFKTRIVGADWLGEWLHPMKIWILRNMYIFCKIRIAYKCDCTFKKTWPHCVECCHFRLLEWAHGLATFFLLFLHAKIVTRSAKRLRQEYCYLNLYSHFAFWSRLVYHNGSKYFLKEHYSFV